MAPQSPLWADSGLVMTVQRVSQKTASLRFTNTFEALQGLGVAENKVPMILCNFPGTENVG